MHTQFVLSAADLDTKLDKALTYPHVQFDQTKAFINPSWPVERAPPLTKYKMQGDHEWTRSSLFRQQQKEKRNLRSQPAITK